MSNDLREYIVAALVGVMKGYKDIFKCEKDFYRKVKLRDAWKSCKKTESHISDSTGLSYHVKH